jgi:starch synthase
MQVLYVSTEVYPALKTGGLADVNAALPPALIRLGADVRLLLPAFPALLKAAGQLERVATLDAVFGTAPVQISRGTLDGVPAYFIEAPEFYARPGNPYTDAKGQDWPDNHLRFALLGWVAARFADGAFDGWRPDIVHGHDWHAGLAPAYLAARGGDRPGSVFTVHNLSYQGQFPAQTFGALALPPHFFGLQGLEFYGKVNFIKAGLHYADRITTVSPTYAREIQTPQQGCGMEGLLRSRAGVLTGILNGVDPQEWNPASDPRIPARYDARRIEGKAICKTALQTGLGLGANAPGPLFGVVSRLTTQKGLDLLLGVLPRLIAGGGQLALLGAGDADLEQGLRAAAAAHPRAVAVRIGYDEDRAHRIVAGADVMVVPSRFEPCGLTQMYGLAYGTLPLVRRVGGLADTVTDAAVPEGDGFVFEETNVAALGAALERVFSVWREPHIWAALRRQAMRADFGWEPSARRYLDLYRELRPHA